MLVLKFNHERINIFFFFFISILFLKNVIVIKASILLLQIKFILFSDIGFFLKTSTVI